MLKCKACGGEYNETSPSGVRYFHTCPPIVRVRVERDSKAQDVDLADVKPTDTITVQRAGAIVKTVVSDRQPDDVRLGDTTAARPGARDENVIVTGSDKAGNPTTAPKLDGAGVETVTK